MQKKRISKQDLILILGANGMVGSAIKRKIIKAGYGCKDLGGNILSPSRTELDLLNINLVRNWFDKFRPKVVILAAAKVGGILANEKYSDEFLLENLKIQLNVIESAKDYGVHRFLFLGSSCIYPKFSLQPISEENLLKGELEKTNECYALAKIAGIKLCEHLNIKKGFDAICLMPTNLYGPGDNYDIESSHVIASLIRKFVEAKRHSSPSVICWGSGTPMREFLHVDDLADASLFALENWDPNDENAPKDNNGNPLYFLNVGTGKDITINDLAEKIKILTGYEGRITWDKSKPDGTPRKLLNIEKFSQLGWESKISLNKGLKDTIDNFSKHNLT